MDTEKVFLGYRHASADASEVTFNLKDFKAMLVGHPTSCVPPLPPLAVHENPSSCPPYLLLG